MKLSSSTWQMIGAVSFIAVAIYIYRRWRSSTAISGFQNLFPRSTEAFQNSATAPPTAGLSSIEQQMVGNPEACKLMKNVLNTINAQLSNAQVLNNPAQLQLLTTTKQGMEAQLAKLQCA